jgi:hypothetical protein
MIARFLPLQVLLIALGIAALRKEIRRYRAASGDNPKAVQIRRIGYERLIYALIFLFSFVAAVMSFLVWGWPTWIGYGLSAIAIVALIGGRWRTLHLEASLSLDASEQQKNSPE